MSAQPEFELPKTSRDELIVSGLVIETRPYGESDLIVTILTPEIGKIRCMGRHARNSRKRFASGLDIFDQGRFVISGGRGDLLNLKSASPSPSFLRIREDLDKLTCASLVCEVLNRLPSEHQDQKNQQSFFELIHLSLEAINEAVSTKGALKAVCICLANICKEHGIGRPLSEVEAGSKLLRQMMNTLEDLTGRSLASRPMVEMMINGLRAAGET